jgi:hypothetical protein
MSLPVTTQQAQQQPAAPTSTMMLIGGRIKDYAAGVLKTVRCSTPFSLARCLMGDLATQRKPWMEVFDRNAFGKPANLTEVSIVP